MTDVEAKLIFANGNINILNKKEDEQMYKQCIIARKDLNMSPGKLSAQVFTKCVLQAKNKYQLLKAKTMAEKLGLKENKDFWLIKDNCLTELEPEENGRTLTVIGFRPMESEVIDQIGKKFQLYT